MDDSDNISVRGMERVQTNDCDDKAHINCNENSIPQNRDGQNHLKRNLVCFWLMGLCGTIGFTVLGSASFDIIKQLEGNSSSDVNVTNNTRDCIADLPVVLIISNTIPGLILKLVLPFIPFQKWNSAKCMHV